MPVFSITTLMGISTYSLSTTLCIPSMCPIRRVVKTAYTPIAIHPYLKARQIDSIATMATALLPMSVKRLALVGLAGMFHGKGLGVVSADFNNDGAPDLYVANDDTRNDFFYNNGDGTFSEISLLAGCAYSFNGVAQAGMGVTVGDYNNDNWFDIFVTNLSYETNALYRNNGDGTFTDVIYEAHLGKESYLYVGFGTGYFDADNDGWLDLFIANGHIIDNIEDTHDILTYRQPDQLFRNNGDGTFQEISGSAGGYFQRPTVSRGALFGDYDNDGDIDMLVTENSGPVTLLRNETDSTKQLDND